MKSEKSEKCRFLPELIPVSILIFAVLLIFGKVIFSGETLYGSDFIFQFYPWKNFLWDTVKTHGAIPFWNPYLFSGTPFIANIQASMFYPLGFLYYFIPTGAAYLYSTLLHCLCGTVFMYFFMRSLRVSRPGALLSGFIFIFNGYFMAHLYAGHLSFIQTYIWIPVIFFFLVRFTQSGFFKNAVAAGLFLGIQILGGFPQLAFYTILAIIFFLFYSCRIGVGTSGAKYFLKAVFAASLIVLTSFSLAAIQVLPTYEFTGLSTRAGGIGYDFATLDSLPFQNLLTFVVPQLFGSPMDGTYWISGSTWEFWEYCGYVGIGALVITAIALRRLTSDRLMVFFLILVVISLFLALGKNNPLYPFFYRLPGFGSFRIPAQIIFLYIFSMAVLTGKGLDLVKDKKVFSLFWKRIACFILIFLLPLVFWSYGFSDNFGNTLFQYIHHKGISIERIKFIVPLVSGAVLVSCGLFLAIVVILYLYHKKSISYFLLVLLLIFISFVDLGAFSAPMIRATDMKPLLNEGRFLRDIKEDPVVSRAAINGRCFIENAGLWYGFQDIQGYDPLILKRYVEYINRSQGLPPDNKVVNLHYVTRFDNNLIRLLNLRYVVDCEGKRLVKINPYIPRCYIVHDMATKDENEILDFMMEERFDPLKQVVFEKGNAPKQILATGAVPISHEKCLITSYENDEIKLVAEMVTPGFLVLSEINYPGWRVTVDGKAGEIFSGNYLFRTVPLHKGIHEVHFTFLPRSFIIGCVVSIITLVFAIALLFLLRERNRSSIK
jgi:hypothetical protein